ALGLRAAMRREFEARVRRFVPIAVGALSLVLFLQVGELVGGAPTHHPERALLVVWLLGTLVVVDLATHRPAPVWALLLALAFPAVDYRQPFLDRGIARRSEEQTGVRLRALVPKGDRAFVATDDFGYFAIQAAFGRPSDTIVDRTHDPRVANE